MTELNKDNEGILAITIEIDDSIWSFKSMLLHHENEQELANYTQNKTSNKSDDVISA